jgi:hypothetical protein
VSEWIEIAPDKHPAYGDRVMLARNVSPSFSALIGFRDYTDKHGEHYCRDGGDELKAEPTHYQALPKDPPKP